MPSINCGEAFFRKCFTAVFITADACKRYPSPGGSDDLPIIMLSQEYLLNFSVYIISRLPRAVILFRTIWRMLMFNQEYLRNFAAV